MNSLQKSMFSLTFFSRAMKVKIDGNFVDNGNWANLPILLDKKARGSLKVCVHALSKSNTYLQHGSELCKNRKLLILL